MTINISVLKEIARNRIKQPVKSEADLIEFLKVWFVQKFNLPDNHPCFLDKTLEELLIDYHLDKFVSDPESLNEQTVEEIKADEERLKEEMGDEYHEEYDYLVDPNTSKEDMDINSINSIPEGTLGEGIEKDSNEINEDFSTKE